jgi:elongation factor Ts
MAITAKDVKSLRDKTGLGMLECKAALDETNGDVQAAIEMLRARGLKSMDGRADRESAEGRIAAVVNADRSKAAIVEVRTETDFTAKNDSFIAMTKQVADAAIKQPVGAVEKTADIQGPIDEIRLTTKENAQFARGKVVGGAGSFIGSYVHHNGKVGVLVELTGPVPVELVNDLCMHVTAVVPVPLGVRDEDVPADVVAKEREIAKQSAIESGKPEQIAEKMVEGKMRKFYEDNTLLKQKFVKDDKKSIHELLPKGVTIKSFTRYELGRA